MSRSTNPTTNRFRLLVAYDGRPFCGWQSQASGDSIQDCILEAIRSICPEAGSLIGSGRTDAGVCAEGQVAHFDVPAEWRMQGLQWRDALNTRLPRTIRIFDCEETSPDFHARYSAKRKTYRYRLYTGHVLPPLLHGLAWHRRCDSPLEDWTRFLQVFEGEHDFRCFSAKRNDGRDETRETRRTIDSAEAKQSAPGQIDLRFTGNGFLYKMVRFLVGTTVYGIEGRISTTGIRDLLSGDEPESKAPYCAPADGLTLEKVDYPGGGE